MAHTYTKGTFYVKFKFNWKSCILSGNLTWRACYSADFPVPYLVSKSAIGPCGPPGIFSATGSQTTL